MRFIKELLKPKLKCARLGHKHVFRYYRGKERTQSSYAVCDSVRGKIYYCPRCGKQHNRTVERRSGIQSWTAPSSMHEELREKGFIET